MASRDIVRGGLRPAPVGRPRSPELDARILSAALDLLADEGTDFRMELVAVNANVPRSTIHRRWPSRSALRAAAVIHFIEGRCTTPDTGTLRGDLSELIRSTLATFGTPLGLRVVRAALELMTDPNETATFALVGDVAQRRWVACRAIVERAIARGELPATASPDLVLELVVGGICVQALRLMPHSDARHLNGLVDAVVGVAGTVVAPPPSRRRGSNGGSARRAQQ